MDHITWLNIIYLTIIAVLAFWNGMLRTRIKDYEEAAETRRLAKVEEYRREAEFSNKGPETLRTWLDLECDAWLVLPRVMMQNMPYRWQADMARLLEQFDQEFPGSPMSKLDFHVTAKHKGKFTSLPEALTNYKQPKTHVLQTWRQSWKP
jgi:hypothetical protein